VLVDAGVAPAEARVDLASLVSSGDVEAIAVGAEADGNPVIGLVALLRQRAGGQAAQWLHRGLTSQDVIDTAMMLCAREVLARVRSEINTQVRTLALAETHQHDPILARTLTQPALPSTVGLKMASWLSGVLDAVDTVAALPPLPVQAGGAAGTMAAATELTGSPGEALALSDVLAHALPWRSPPHGTPPGR
jgi:3-carboxy-cis,cis-muconate cycloisomerase